MNSLTVLIVNRSMHAFSGTELYVRDVALELQRQGHRAIVFTPEPGIVSDQLAGAGIPVLSDINELEQEPDIVHGHHAWTTLAVLSRFPTTPAIFVGHDASSWTDAPPLLRQIRRYVAVDHALFERFVRRHSIPESRVQVVANAIDFGRFRQRGPLPAKPEKALLISNYSGHRERAEIQAACDLFGISLDAVGRRFGNVSACPEELYGLYDLVFAKGRCVLEAAATGTAVVYCDTLGCGPVLTCKVLDEGKGILAGRHLLSEPLTRDTLVRRIEAYDPDEALNVSRRIRAAYESSEIVSSIVGVYRDVIAEHKLDPDARDAGLSRCSLTDELIRWSLQAEGIFQKHFEGKAQLMPDESPDVFSRNAGPGCGLDGAIGGQGWYPSESDSKGRFCWIGPERFAWIDMQVSSGSATDIRIRIAHAMDGELLRGLEIRVNGQATGKRFANEGGPVIRVSIPSTVSIKSGGTVRIMFVLPKTIRPSDRDPSSIDHRLLGIAVRQIGFECGRSELVQSPEKSALRPEKGHSPMPVVFGSPRSGTTLLRMMLDAHPDLAMPPETGFLAMARQISGAPGNVVDNFFETVTTYPPEAPGWEDFWIDDNIFRSRLNSIEPFSIAEGFRVFYRMYAERFGKSRWGDKTPMYGHHLKMIEDVLPEARFVHVVRDGRDAALSLRELWFSPGQDIGTQAMFWRDNISAAREQGLLCLHFMEIRYEDLLRNPASGLQRICEFIELDFHSDMLDFHKRSPARMAEHGTRFRLDGSVLISHDQRISTRKLLMEPPVLSRVGVWKTGMTSVEQLEFQSIAGHLLDQYGYCPSGQ